MDTPNPVPAKKTPAAPQLGDKYNIKPPVLKRPRYCPCCRQKLTCYLISLQLHLVVHSCIAVYFHPLAPVPWKCRIWRKNTSHWIPHLTLPKKSKLKSFQHSVSLHRTISNYWICCRSHCSLVSYGHIAAMECTGFLDALNSAPVPGIKIKKKKPGAGTSVNAKAVSPTTTKVLTNLWIKI